MPRSLKKGVVAIALLLALALVGGAALLWRYDPARYRLYPRCQLHALTGLQCPGCGGLRALHALLHGRVGEAFRFNPLFVVGLPVALGLAGWWLWRKWRRPDLPAGPPMWCLWMIVGLVVGFGVLRNVPAVAALWGGP